MMGIETDLNKAHAGLLELEGDLDEIREQIHGLVEEYALNGRFPTVVGRPWDLSNSSSRADFVEFLTKHITGVVLLGRLHETMDALT